VAKAAADIRSLARAHTETGIKVLAQIVGSSKAPAAARVIAIKELFDRGWGKAPQQLTGEDGGDIRITIRQIIANAVETEPGLIEHLDGNGKDATS
jgi:hypothetical protein